MIPLLALVFLAQSFLVGYELLSGPYDPLGDDPSYYVVNSKEGGDLPVVHINEDVKMDADRCVEADHPVDVLVNASWATVAPRGTSITSVENASLVRQPGCSASDLSVDIPEGVVERTKELQERGHERVVWKISGYDTPIDQNGEPGVVVPWQTNEFVVTAL